MLFKPAPAHNPRLAPAVCLCVDCSRIILAKRCPTRDSRGRQCGNYRHRSREHALLVATVFQIAAERVDAYDREVDAANFGPLPTWSRS